MNPFDCEKVIAAEAKDYAKATMALNPYAEAEAIDLGVLAAVYCGQSSPVHGIFLLDPALTERDLREAEEFLERKERKPWYWEPQGIESFSSLRNTEVVYKQKVFGKPLTPPSEKSPAKPTAQSDWVEIFSNSLKKTAIGAKEIFAETKFQQANTRFYSDATGATYTYFMGGVAFVPYASSDALLERQCQEAAQWGSQFLITFDSRFPYLYERTLHEAH